MGEYVGSINTVDTESSFMNSLYPGGFISSKFVNAQSFENRRVGNYKYRDPDADSEDLYNSLCALYNGRALPNGSKFNLGKMSSQYGYHFEISISNTIHKFSSDYIGPSATGAFHAGVANKIVGEAILACRTIGGHTLWPRHTNSVSQARGGSLTDRIDLTLAELKDFYVNPNSGKYLYSQKLRKAFYTDKEWLMQFESFKGFCDFFFFTGSFIDEQYNIIWLAPVQATNYYRPQDYVSFMKNNEHSIKARTALIKAFLSGEKGVRNPTISKTVEGENECPKKRSFANAFVDYFSLALLVVLIVFMIMWILAIFIDVTTRTYIVWETIIGSAVLALLLIYPIYRVFRWRHRNTRYCSKCKKAFWLEKMDSVITEKKEISIKKEQQIRNSVGDKIQTQEQYIPGTRYFYTDSYQCLHCFTKWNITYSIDKENV